MRNFVGSMMGSIKGIRQLQQKERLKSGHLPPYPNNQGQCAFQVHAAAALPLPAPVLRAHPPHTCSLLWCLWSGAAMRANLNLSGRVRASTSICGHCSPPALFLTIPDSNALWDVGDNHLLTISGFAGHFQVLIQLKPLSW